jgi:hypothetical protein
MSFVLWGDRINLAPASLFKPASAEFNLARPPFRARVNEVLGRYNVSVISGVT